MNDSELPRSALDGLPEREGPAHHLKVAARVNLFVVVPVAAMLTLLLGSLDLDLFGRYLLVVFVFTNAVFLLLDGFYHLVWLRSSLGGAQAYLVLGFLVLPALGALGTFAGDLVLGLVAPGLLRVGLDSLLPFGVVLTTLYGLAIYRLEDYRRAQVLDRRRLDSSRRRELAGEQARHEAELTALQALIKPHFIFNVLSAIATLIDEDPEKAEETTLRLARLLRYILDIGDSDLIRLEEEISIVAAYLEIEKVRQGERLSYEIDLPDELRPVSMPGMVLQPLVENAILHGVRQRGAAGGYVHLAARREGEQCVVEIRDNGPGFTTHRGTGKATRLLRGRLGRVYGEAYDLAMERRGGETVVELRVPARRASDRRIVAGEGIA